MRLWYPGHVVRRARSRTCCNNTRGSRSTINSGANPRSSKHLKHRLNIFQTVPVLLISMASVAEVDRCTLHEEVARPLAHIVVDSISPRVPQTLSFVSEATPAPRVVLLRVDRLQAYGCRWYTSWYKISYNCSNGTSTPFLTPPLQQDMEEETDAKRLAVYQRRDQYVSGSSHVA